MSKEYTIEDFEIEEVMMKDTGSWVNDNPYHYGVSCKGYYDISYSDILTYLIQTAGRVCKHYASDLFITWCGLTETLREFDCSNEKILFGFRESGVDSNTFVLSRLNNYGKEGLDAEIKELYLLDITIDKTYFEASGKLERMDITMEFGKAKLKGAE